jgi:hypothetical protein
MNPTVIAIAGVAALAVIVIAVGVAMSGGSGISDRLERYASGQKPDSKKSKSTGQGPISDLIVHQSRLKDGTRKITNITEVQGMEGDVIVMQDVFVFEQTGIVEGKIQGRLKPTGIRPKFVEKFEVMGIHLPPGLFGYTY